MEYGKAALSQVTSLSKTALTSGDVTTVIGAGKNIFDKTKVITGKEVYGDGSIRDRADAQITDYMDVQGFANVYISGLPTYTTSESGGNRYAYFYDANKAPIGTNVLISASITEKSVIVPSGAKYFVLSIYQRKTSGETINLDIIQVENGTVKTAYEAFNVSPKVTHIKGVEIKQPQILQAKGYTSKLEGKKWNVLGDSITDAAHTAATKKYHAVIKDTVNVTVNNYGIASTEISSGGTFANPMITRYTSMDNTANLITVFGGVNDYLHAVEVGTFDSRDSATFYGALHNLCSGLYTNFPNAKYAFFTPMQTNGTYGDGVSANAKGYKLADYVKAIKEVCTFYSIPVLDLNSMSGLTPYVSSTKTKYMPDGLHPNNSGHSIIASKILAFIETIL